MKNTVELHCVLKVTQCKCIVKTTITTNSICCTQLECIMHDVERGTTWILILLFLATVSDIMSYNVVLNRWRTLLKALKVTERPVRPRKEAKLLHSQCKRYSESSFMCFSSGALHKLVTDGTNFAKKKKNLSTFAFSFPLEPLPHEVLLRFDLKLLHFVDCQGEMILPLRCITLILLFFH